jgi:hypothetical protein
MPSAAWLIGSNIEFNRGAGFQPVPQLLLSPHPTFPSPLPFMAEYTKFQQKAIKNFYDNREDIALQRVQELVTELYLTEGKKRAKHWDSVALHLGKLGVKPDVIEHLRKQDKPELVATLVKKLIEKS